MSSAWRWAWRWAPHGDWKAGYYITIRVEVRCSLTSTERGRAWSEKNKGEQEGRKEGGEEGGEEEVQGEGGGGGRGKEARREKQR